MYTDSLKVPPDKQQNQKCFFRVNLTYYKKYSTRFWVNDRERESFMDGTFKF